MRRFLAMLVLVHMAASLLGAEEDGYANPGGVTRPEDARVIAGLLSATGDVSNIASLNALVDRTLANGAGVSEYHAFLNAYDRAGDLARKLKIYEELFRRFPSERQSNLADYRETLKKTGQSEAVQREWMKVAGRKLGGAQVRGVAITADAVWAATDKGAFRCNRQSREWMRMAVNDEYLDKPVDSIVLGDDGRLTFSIDLNGTKAIFIYKPETLQWIHGKP